MTLEEAWALAESRRRFDGDAISVTGPGGYLNEYGDQYMATNQELIKGYGPTPGDALEALAQKMLEVESLVG